MRTTEKCATSLADEDVEAILNRIDRCVSELCALRRRVIRKPSRSSGDAVRTNALQAVVIVCGYPIEQVLGACRDHALSEPRVIAARLMRDAGMTCEAIAHALKRDHSTVVHMLRKRHDKWLVQRPGYVDAFKEARVIFEAAQHLPVESPVEEGGAVNPETVSVAKEESNA